MDNKEKAKETIKKHQHLKPTPCEHKDLAYCKKCDVVYCKDCGKEWKQCPATHTWTYLDTLGNSTYSPFNNYRAYIYCPAT